MEIVAGGAANRMQKTLKAEGIKLEDKDYRIWTLDIWNIVKAIREKKGMKHEVPVYAKEGLTLGQRSMLALAEGVRQVEKEHGLEEGSISDKLNIVIHISGDIKEDVERDLRDKRFHGGYFIIIRK